MCVHLVFVYTQHVCRHVYILCVNHRVYTLYVSHISTEQVYVSMCVHVSTMHACTRKRAVCTRVLPCAAVCSRVLPCVAVCSVVKWVAVCSSALECAAVRRIHIVCVRQCGTLQCAAVRHTHICMCAYIYSRTYIYVRRIHIYVCAHTYMCGYICMHTYIYIYVCAHTYMCTLQPKQPQPPTTSHARTLPQACLPYRAHPHQRWRQAEAAL